MSTIIPYTSWHHTAAAAGAVDWSIQILVNGLPVGCSSRSARTSDQRHESQVLFGGVIQPAPHGASCTHSQKQQHKVKIQDADMTRCRVPAIIMRVETVRRRYTRDGWKVGVFVTWL